MYVLQVQRIPDCRRTWWQILSRPAAAPLLCWAPHGFGTVAVPMPVSTEHQSLHAPDSHITPTSESQPTVCTSMRIKLTNWGNYRFHEYNFYKKRDWQKRIWYNSSAWIIWRRCGYLVRRERDITFAAGSWISISWLIELTNKSHRLKTQTYKTAYEFLKIVSCAFSVISKNTMVYNKRGSNRCC